MDVTLLRFFRPGENFRFRPAQFRVNGPLANMPEFQRASNIPDSSPMVWPGDKRVNN